MAQRELSIDDQWLDRLMAAARQYLTIVQAQVDALTLRTCPPKLLFDTGAAWQEQALGVHRAYYNVISKAIVQQTSNSATYDAAFKATVRALAQWPEHGTQLLAGVMSLVYMVSALRQFVVSGEPLWTTTNIATTYWQDAASALTIIPLTLNGAWWNYAKCYQQRYMTMNAVPKGAVKQFKQRLEKVAPKLVGSKLTIKAEADQLVTVTEHGNLFGYMKRSQEQLLANKTMVAIDHIRVTPDGNVNALVAAI